MNVFYSLTRNLYPYLQWSITSLLEHNKDVNLYIFAEDETLPFDIPCEHQIADVSGQKYFGLECPNINSPFTYMAMIRVCLPEMLSIDKVISLDVDTIICDSIEPLWETDLTGKWIGWCQEYFGKYKPFCAKYYNMGVTVMNLEQMRKDGFTPKAVKMLNTETFPYIDQCVTNKLAVPDMTVDIPVRYNESFCCGYTDEPAIVHYAGYRNWYENQTMFRKGFLNKYRGEQHERNQII